VKPRFLLLSLLVLCAPGCSDSTSPEANTAPPSEIAVTKAVPPDSPPEAAEEAEGSDQAVARPPAPPSNFEDRSYKPPGWYDDLKARYSPTKDGWPTEVIAQFAQRALAQGLEELLTTGEAPALERVLAKKFEGTSVLRPAEPEVLREDGGMRVVRAVALPAELRAPEDWLTELRSFVAPLRPATDHEVSLHVTTVLPAGPRSFDTWVHVRVAGRLGAGSQQINANWRLHWRVPQQGGGIVLLSLTALDFEEVVFAEVPFEEHTSTVFADQPFLTGDLMLGSIELYRRVDRSVGFAEVYLGMHGMAVGDIDGDGLEDIYVGQPGGMRNRLFLGAAAGGVVDVSRTAGVDFLDDTAGVLILDVDGDRRRDLVLGRGSDILICYGDGKGSFTRRELLAGDGIEQVYSISAADPDSDGDLDLYATRYVSGGVAGGVPTPYHDARNGSSNYYWRNDGEGGFHNATEEVGLGANNDRFSLASIWEDFDSDGDLDLYVTNDFGRNNLYMNDGGRFTDVADQVGAYDMAAGMGVTCADVDLDGDIDMYVSNMFTAAGKRVTSLPGFMSARGLEMREFYSRHTRGNSLLLNRGDGTFEDATDRARCGPGGWAWGAMFADYDNDGRPDVHVPNGFCTGALASDVESFFWRVVVNASPDAPPSSPEYTQAWVAVSQMSQREGLSWNGRERNYAYWNVGDTFADASMASGLAHRDDSRAVCVVDWDRDGRLDLWVRNRTSPGLRFLRNTTAHAGGWVAFELVGATCHPEAIGALVEVKAGGRTLRRRIYAGEGYLGGSSRRLHFGLADATEIESVSILWPDGIREELVGVQPGHLHRVVQGVGSAMPLETPASSPFDGKPPVALATNGKSATRVPVLDKLPYASLSLPTFEGEAKTVRDFAGLPLLVYLWGSWDEHATDGLTRLGAAMDTLGGVQVFPLSIDGVREDEATQHFLGESDLTSRGGRTDRRTKVALEVAFFELLGSYPDLPLPIGVLFDPDGQISMLYIGDVDPDHVRADSLALLENQGRAGERWPSELTGGRWVDRGPERELDMVLGVFEKYRFPNLANDLRSAIEARAAGD